MSESTLPATITHAIFAVALAAPRMLVAFALLPYFASPNMPRLMLSAISCVMVFPMMPTLLTQLPPQPDSAWLLLTIVKEGAIGLLLGYACAIPFWAIEAAGNLIDNQRGAAMAQMLDVGSGNMVTPLSLLFNQAFTVLFLTAGGLGTLLTLLYDSYRVWPIVDWMPRFDSAFVPYSLGMLDAIMRLAILLAAPAIIAMLVSEIALALVSLFAPQLQVFFLAMPIKSGVALFILLTYLYTLVNQMLGQVTSLETVLPVLRSVTR